MSAIRESQAKASDDNSAITVSNDSGGQGDASRPSVGGGSDASNLYCSECDHYERDPIFLDVETCSKCGELLEGSE